MAKWKPSTILVPFPEVRGVHFARIPSYIDYAASDDGHIWSSKSGRWKRMSAVPRPNGYLTVGLCRRNKVKRYKVARLVLMAFQGLPPVGMECCHNDGDRLNDQLSNLRWDTKSNNTNDSIRHRTYKSNWPSPPCGEANWSSTIPYETVKLIRATNGKPNFAAVAREFRVSRPHVRKIVLGLSRLHS